MFVNESLDEEKQKEVILHELGHALNHKTFLPYMINLHLNLKWKMKRIIL